MVEPWGRLALGLLTGVLFGVLLQRGRLAKHTVIMRQLLLQEWTVARVMGTAIVVGSLGVHALYGLGIVDLHIKPLVYGGILGGGVLFGVGMAVLGYCPGTGIAAAGEGHRDAWAGVLGMLAGSGLYVATYPFVRPLLARTGDAGAITLSQALGGSPALWLIALIFLAAGVWWVIPSRRTERARARQRAARR